MTDSHHPFEGNTPGEIAQEMWRLRSENARLSAAVAQIQEVCEKDPRDRYGEEYPWDERDVAAEEVRAEILSIVRESQTDNSESPV